MTIAYRCPVCHSALERENSLYRCTHNHCFDVAKEGYVNLLPVQHKKSKDPGDNTLMVQARNAFLRQGYYRALCNKIAYIARKIHPGAKALLDIGCGIGWYAEEVTSQLTITETHGIDISKHAIKVAAKSAKRLQKTTFNYAVASAYDLPYPDSCMDIVLSVFSPLKPEEIQRVLKPNGICIIVGTGPGHLHELAEKIYEKVVSHQGSAIDVSNCKHLVEDSNTHTYRELIAVQNEDLGNLLAMTPYYWSTSKEKKQEIEKLAELEVQLDFDIRVLKRV